jgi:hypothetical protein
MFTSLPISPQICFSGTAGGGVHGKDAGIARCFIAAGGFIIRMFQVSILMWTRVGGQVTETATGMDTGGTMNGFLTSDFNKIGRTGKRIAIGNGRQTGVCGTIDPNRNSRDRM